MDPINKHLVWENHDKHITFSFCELLQKQSLVDVSIVCADKIIHAHKLMLSASSPLFHRMIEENPCKHPIIILHDYPSWVIDMILGFIYYGEINIPSPAMYIFIEVAKELQIKGLKFVNDIKNAHTSPLQQPRRKQPKPNKLLEQENVNSNLGPLDFSLKVSSTNNVVNEANEINDAEQKENMETVEKNFYEGLTMTQNVGEHDPAMIVKHSLETPEKEIVEETAVKKVHKQTKRKSITQDVLNLPYPTLPCK